MDIGLVVRNSGVSSIQAVQEMPQIAEELGYRSVWLTDHVIGMPTYAPKYELEWSEALTCLSFIAASTTDIRIGVGVLVVPYRHPVYAAKVLSTIDNLSSGRLLVGIGSGWSRREYAALGHASDYDARGTVTDEAVDVILRCWTGGDVQWQGEHFSVPKVSFAPLPTQLPHPPIWVGGNTLRAIRRASRFGDAWHPTNLPAEDLARLGDQLDEMAGRKIRRTVRARHHPRGHRRHPRKDRRIHEGWMRKLRHRSAGMEL